MSVIEAQPDRLTPEGLLALAGSRLGGSEGGVGALSEQRPRREAEEELENVLDAVIQNALGRSAREAVQSVQRPFLAVGLLRELRRKILEAPEARDHPAETVEALRAVDTVQSALGPSDPEDMRARLLAPDAFELLVEVAHDLRSPLTSILFLSETLRVGHSGEVNDLQKSQLGLIYSAALGLVSVVSDVMDLAKGERGVMDTEATSYSLSEVVNGVEELVAPMAEEKGVELRVVLPDYDRAHGHPTAIGRALLNLTTNALKFTEDGWVEIGARLKSGSKIEFFVKDTGRGMDPDREDLFHPFKKAQNRDGQFFSGSGLGLSIVRRMVRLMGSELQLQSAPGKGTQFSFTVDIQPPRGGSSMDTSS